MLIFILFFCPRMAPRFHLHVVSKGGTVIDAKRFEPDSLLAAAALGHGYQVQDGCVFGARQK
jgi:hypothetical protein